MWNPTTNRWLVEIRYPDGSRIRKRVRREREALRVWVAEQARIENGTWDERAARHATVGVAMAGYRAYSKVQHRSHRSFVAPSCTMWEHHLGAQTSLAKVTSQQVEAFKLKRAQQFSHGTTDKDLAVLKAFFNWCIAHGLAASNPVRRVKLFHEDNSRLRYLTRDEYDRPIEAARTLASRSSVSTPSPYLVEKIVLAAHTGLRRGSLFNLRCDQIDLTNRATDSADEERPATVGATQRDRRRCPQDALRGSQPGQPVGLCASRRTEGRRTGPGHQERLPCGPGVGRDQGLHLARPAAHLRVVADDVRRLAAQRRRAAWPSVDEDDDALRALVAGVSVCGSRAARSASSANSEGRENKKGKKRAKCLDGRSLVF